MIDINGEMKIQDLQINDDALLDPKEKKELQKLLMVAITKAQNKAQEVVQEKTKEIL
ncbi:YbaB/EbfC family nucleoid-associated protein [Patescibacteria group bacterium]|nr:YbaB/EbfC family nucleoid-associated protein [Patescibacteria group bacterium]MBP7841739.1 YbaB/EbfC family nucleoid-associated protein [Patescibacteria group bacterium]